MKSLRELLQDKQLEKDMLENDIINDLEEAKDVFTSIYLAELIVKALGEKAEDVKNEMEYYMTYENPKQKLWKDTYDPEML